MKLKDLFISLRNGASCVLKLKSSDSLVLDYCFVIDDRQFLSEFQEIFGDLLISKVDVLKDIYFTIILDSDLFTTVKDFLERRGF